MKTSTTFVGSWNRPVATLQRFRKPSNSAVSLPVLSMRGTLFCPPSFPRVRIQSSKVPGGAVTSVGDGRPPPEARNHW